MHFKPLNLAIMASLALPLSAFAASPNINSAVAQRAQALTEVRANATALQRADYESFITKDTIVDSDGTEHTRMKRFYRGLPVIGGDLVMKARNNQFKSVSQTLKTKLRPGLTPKITADEAMVAAGADFNGSIKSISSKGLVIYAMDKHPVLAYEVNLVGQSADHGFSDLRYFVDANTGKPLDAWNQFKTVAATGTGNTLLLGDVSLTTDKLSATSYRLVDPSRGNGSTRNGGGGTIDLGTLYLTAPIMTDRDNNWGNNAESSVASEASDAHYGVAKTWDFYKNTFNRNGIYNDGVGVKSIVNVKFCTWPTNTTCGTPTGGNAGWYGDGTDGTQYRFMAYGQGTSSWWPVVAIDVAGHEMTHGVTDATADLAYNLKDSGGLNESSSDILGTMVEFYANNASDPGDYLIGEKVYRSNPSGKTALRYMFKPSIDGRSYDCYPTGGFINTDPHYSSGVGNHFFYLLAEGQVVPSGFGSGTTYNLTAAKLVCNGATGLVGIGRDKAAAIWYRALTTKFTSGTSYPQARVKTLEAAGELYGVGSPEYNAVAAAWSAVAVN